MPVLSRSSLLPLLLSVVLTVPLATPLTSSAMDATAARSDGERAPDLVLRGQLDGRDHQTYRTVPFEVPAGTSRISVQFDHDGREDKTTIDLGLLGPGEFAGADGFRGWSGGNKRHFTVSTTDATPSYLPGPIRAGTWSLLLGVPNIREDSRAAYSAKVWFEREGEPEHLPSMLTPTLRAAAGWYRGDLHLHDAHSDGSCASQSGTKVPCPLFLTAQAAAARGLDFIAITDHNTVSHAQPMRELQPYFDRLLLIPGRELTTFSGHANLFGPVAPLDFRVAGDRDWNALLRDVRRVHGVVSVNHPIRPSDERCMGCGWTPSPAADPALLQAVEVVNGADADTPYSGIPFWERLLGAGHRLTAIGGSDNHDAGKAASDAGGGAIGHPTTVVHAQSLSMQAILDGLRAGRVFVDVEGSRDRLLDFVARAGDAQAHMGDRLRAASGTQVAFEVRVEHVGDGRIELIRDGRPFQVDGEESVDGASHRLRFAWRADGHAHWLRANVRGRDGRLLLVGNPIYLQP